MANDGAESVSPKEQEHTKNVAATLYSGIYLSLNAHATYVHELNTADVSYSWCGHGEPPVIDGHNIDI